MDHPFCQAILRRKRLIGMVHVRALPGTPGHGLSPAEIVETAVREATTYLECGIDTVLIENMHDVPYTRTIGPEGVAMMTAAGRAVKQAGLTCGIQILAGANREALAVALAAELDFVRVEGFVYAHVADEGLIQACAGELLRYRRTIGAEHIPVMADIKKKHSSHAITADVDIVETAETAEFFGADGLIVTGRATGKAAWTGEVRAVRRASALPVLIGSGITPENLPDYVPHADAFIVGSYVKTDGIWSNPLCRERIGRLIEAFSQCIRSDRGPRSE